MSSRHDAIRNIVSNFLSGCGLSFSPKVYDSDLHNACYEAARYRGFSNETLNMVGNTMIVGVSIAATTYSHLDESSQIFVALSTALLAHLDDAFEIHIEGIRVFNEQFMRNESHDLEILELLADMLREMPGRFGQVQSNIMIISVMNFITSLLVEHNMPQMTGSKSHTLEFANYFRKMSGVGELFAVFTFPPDIPWTNYIEAMPELVGYINTTNDILSFYKEELSGEITNRISIHAASQNISTLKVMEILSEETVAGDARVLKILGKCPKATFAYQVLRQGYVDLHASLARYKLEELMEC